MQFLQRFSNSEAAIVYLLKSLGVYVKPSEISDELEKHPDNPSMLAISDVLNWFKIENIAYFIDVEELPKVPTPFIAHTNRDNDFVTVHQVSDIDVRLSDDKRKNYSLTLAEFSKIFTGVVLQAEAPKKTESLKHSYIHKLLPYKWLFAILILISSFAGILFFYTDFANNLTWQVALLTLLKSAGLATSILLLMQSIDKNNPLVQTLCGGGKKNNCNAILTSEAATVFEGLTWSEVGFFYFAGTWLALLFNSGSTSLIQLLAILNILSLPYTVYSINYQARIAKEWCMFCITVQILLWLEFLTLVKSLQLPIDISTPIIISLLIFMAMPIAVWILLKPVFIGNQQQKIVRYQLRKFKFNRELFEASLKKQPRYTTPSDEWSIILGSMEANTIITMVSNPYCQPCSASHEILDKWLDRSNNVQLRIVFTALNNHEDRKTPVVRHLMALNAKGDKELIKKALNDWYKQENKDYANWSRAYPIDNVEDQFYVLDNQKIWCNMAEITVTPTLLINGYRLPKEYQIQDIKYLLD